MPSQAATLQFQDFSTVQDKSQLAPVTIASANTIAPVGFLTILTGNTVIKTITPPLEGIHMLAIMFAGAAGVDNSQNINTTVGSVAGQVLLFIWNPVTRKYLVNV